MSILTLGLFIAHGTNNLINDYTDFSRGIDKDNYFRTQYGVHPLAQGSALLASLPNSPVCGPIPSADDAIARIQAAVTDALLCFHPAGGTKETLPKLSAAAHATDKTAAASRTRLGRAPRMAPSS